MGLLDNKPAAGGSEDKDGPEGWIKRLVVAAERVAQAAFPFLPKMSGAGENSVSAGLEFGQVVKAFNPAPSPFGGLKSDGGVLAKVFAQVAKLNMNVSGLPVEAVSRADLGTFSPPVFEGMRTGGIEMGGLST